MTTGREIASFTKIKVALLALSLSTSLLLPVNLANAASFAEYSGKIVQSDGTPFVQGTAKCNQTQAVLSNADGTYKIICDTSSELEFKLYNFAFTGQRCEIITLDPKYVRQAILSVDLKKLSSTSFSVTMPTPITISLSLVDAQNNPIPDYYLSQRRGEDDSGWDNFLFSFKTPEGVDLQGVQYITAGCTYFAKSNPVVFALYPEPFLGSLTIYANTNRTPVAQRGITNSGPLYGTNSQVIKMCMPVNFGTSLTLPPDCYDGKDVKAARDKAARDKAAADRAAIEQAARDKAASEKKQTITCLKGKLTKKVTAIKPKCPSGYKLKK
jgi:hypothetical protein